MVSLCMVVRHILSNDGSQMLLTQQYDVVEESSRIERTNRSAYAFKFGLLAGSCSGFTLASRSSLRNTAV